MAQFLDQGILVDMAVESWQCYIQSLKQFENEGKTMPGMKGYDLWLQVSAFRKTKIEAKKQKPMGDRAKPSQWKLMGKRYAMFLLFLNKKERKAKRRPVHQDFQWRTFWFFLKQLSAAASRSAGESTVFPAHCTRSRSSCCSQFLALPLAQLEVAWRLALEARPPRPLKKTVISAEYLNSIQSVRLHSHKHEYKSGTVRVPVCRVPANTSLHIFQWRPFICTGYL